ncbi:hypothetical protein HG531_009938 [Fusarium graminearum]|nr:hypothetical protein HG531_009938 [Fusarium graminearum]
MNSLVAVVGKSLGGLLLDSGVLLGIGQLSGGNLLALVVGGTLGLSSLLQTVKTNLVGQTTDSAELAAGLESENAESLGNDDLLGLVVGRGDTLEDLKALESSGTTGSLVGDHATDGLVEDSGRSAEVEGTYIESMTVVQCSGNGFDSPPRVGLYRVIFRRHTLGAEELSGDVKGLTTDDNNLLTAKELLGDNGGESAKEMALAIDDDL